MLDKATQFLNNLELHSTDTILVAVSGGLDSMCLAHLLHSQGFNVAIAHCNFTLRGEESNGDYQFVKDWAQEHEIAFHSEEYATKSLTTGSGQSVQMIARTLRYDFFERLKLKHGYKFTAFAHHADDRIESLLLNILRGTGLRGLQGMPSKRGNIIRPLLSITKQELTNYANTHHVPFRTDSSNVDTKYQRNRVRLEILPILRILDTTVEKRLLYFMNRVENNLVEYDVWVNAEKGKICNEEGGFSRIDRKLLNKHPFPFTILKELLGLIGFNSNQVMELIKHPETVSGELMSDTHRLVIEQNDFIVCSLKEAGGRPNFSFEQLNLSEITNLKTDNQNIFVDAYKVDEFKISLRRWCQGDRFKPLGMKGWKKVSDYFIDSKFTSTQKENTWLMVHNQDIIWIVGHRMDDRFKVTEQTKEVLHITSL